VSIAPQRRTIHGGAEPQHIGAEGILSSRARDEHTTRRVIIADAIIAGAAIQR